MKTSILLVPAVLVLGGCASMQHDARLESLITDYEAVQSAQRPDRDAGEWPDISRQATDQRRETIAGLHERLQDIDPASLSEHHAVNHATLDYLIRSQHDLGRFDGQRFPFTNDSGFFTGPAQAGGTMRLRTVEDAERWIARLEGVPGYFDQQVAWLRDGIDSSWTQAAHIMPAVLSILEAIVANDAEHSTFYRPFTTLPETMPEEERARLRLEGLAVVSEQVLPAYHALIRFFEDEYIPAARADAGIWAVPGGRDYYRALVRMHTTLDTTPEEVHARGLAEVARIRAEMEEVIAETGFDGSFAEFLDFMRTDPRFYAQSEEELLMRAAWIAKRADDQMPRFFGNLPRLPYGVRPVPPEIAPNYTTGRYWPGNLERGQAGGYMVNTYALDQRPLYELPSLTVHEGVPGHHHQFAISQELEGVPEFRRGTYITAFGEGWGLYTEFLAIEMGIYDTPYEHFGRLTFEMWRACRLVVDTGMHYFEWTVEQAEACLLENSALASHNVRTEVARYVSWPGQALAYKTGELLIRDLRTRAEEALGERFDLRAFHDHLLSEGAMPLSALEARMVAWIDAQ
jgi:uncharacterized protein (DUF885 family)